MSRLEGLSDAVFGFAITLLTALPNVGVGVLSICVAAFGRGDASLAAAGFTYALLGPLMTADGVLRGRHRRRLMAGLPADGPALPAAAAG